MPLDPDAKKVCDLIVAANRPSYHSLTPGQAREVYLASRKVFQPPVSPAVDEVSALTCPGPAGPIPLRMYRNKSRDPNPPCLVYYHGGGWVIGNLDSHDGICRDLANHGRCVVISVDYRLAPEHKFPAAAEDCIAAMRWIAANAATLRIDADRLAIGGDSAGGNTAAVVALAARDKSGPRIGLQLLVYPATDMGATHASHTKHAAQLPLTRETMQWFTNHYMRNEADKADWRASPLRAKSLAGVAPAYVMIAGYDPLGDEGLAYAAALKAAGVPVETRIYEGQIHGFLSMGALIAEAHTAIDDLGAALVKSFGH